MATITTTWTVLSFAFGSLLTSTKMTQLYNNGVMNREWIGESHINSAEQDHNHNGINSALIAGGAISPIPTGQGSFYTKIGSGIFTIADGTFQIVRTLGDTRLELFNTDTSTWVREGGTLTEGIFFVSSGHSRLVTVSSGAFFGLKY